MFWHRKSKITARITVGGVVINSASWIVNNALMLPFISAILHSSFIYCAWTFVFSFPFFDWLKRSIRFRINWLSSIISSLINLKTQSSLRVNRSAHSLWPNSSLKQSQVWFWKENYLLGTASSIQGVQLAIEGIRNGLKTKVGRVFLEIQDISFPICTQTRIQKVP